MSKDSCEASETGATLLALSKVLGCRMEDLLEYDNCEIKDNDEDDV